MSKAMFEISEKLAALRQQKRTQEEELKNINAHISETELALVAMMVDEDVPSFKHDGHGFSLVVQNFPQAEPERKDELYDALKKRGYEHLFTINHRTLTSTLKEMIAANEDVLPDWLDGLVKQFEKTTIRVTKG